MMQRPDQSCIVPLYAECSITWIETGAITKHANKLRLAALARSIAGVVIDPHSLFDVHVKRVHEYRRQLLNVMQVIHHYFGVMEDGNPLPAVIT